LALLRNPMRSLLTVLGVVIGVGAVIAMVAIGEGAKAKVEQAFASMGSNLLIVLPGSSSRGGAMGGFGSAPTLTWEDLKAIRQEASAVRFAAAVLRSNVQLVAEEQNWTTTLYGTSQEYLQARDWAVASGRGLTDSDVEAAAKVVVLGQTTIEKLYGPSADPIGQSVRIKNTPFEIIGVLARKGQSASGQDYDDTGFVPQSTFQQRIQGGSQAILNGTMLITATSADDTIKAQRQVTALLRDRHRLPTDADDDFSVRNLAEMANAQQEGVSTLTTLLAAIAAVSLLVGGIGIMNIMLVSVTERTREIGLRMAVGARPSDILLQFLVEALVLAMVGGAIGVGVGLLTAYKLAEQFEWPVLFRQDVIWLAVGFSALVGVVFGAWPARKAAALDPIDALRFE
jgi:putative ABC transport system permease protein